MCGKSPVPTEKNREENKEEGILPYAKRKPPDSSSSALKEGNFKEKRKKEKGQLLQGQKSGGKKRH